MTIVEQDVSWLVGRTISRQEHPKNIVYMEVTGESGPADAAIKPPPTMLLKAVPHGVVRDITRAEMGATDAGHYLLLDTADGENAVFYWGYRPGAPRLATGAVKLFIQTGGN